MRNKCKYCKSNYIIIYRNIWVKTTLVKCIHFCITCSSFGTRCSANQYDNCLRFLFKGLESRVKMKDKMRHKQSIINGYPLWIAGIKSKRWDYNVGVK